MKMSEVFRKSKETLTEKNWWRGEMCTDRQDKECVWTQTGVFTYNQRCAARESYFKKALGIQFLSDLFEYNDNPKTTLKDIHDLLEKAAILAEQDGN